MSGIQVNNVFHGCGRLGNNPDVKNHGDRKIISFSIAIDRSWVNANGEKMKKTNWVRCVAFHPLSKYIEACHVKKGSKVSVTGSIEIEEFEKDGQKRQSFSIWLNGFEKQSKEEGESQQAQGQQQPTAEMNPEDEDLPF